MTEQKSIEDQMILQEQIVEKKVVLHFMKTEKSY